MYWDPNTGLVQYYIGPKLSSFQMIKKTHSEYGFRTLVRFLNGIKNLKITWFLDILKSRFLDPIQNSNHLQWGLEYQARSEFQW